MFCAVDTGALASVKSVPALVSAAELLNQLAPVISGAFIQYAIKLCDAHFAVHGLPLDTSEYTKLKQLVTFYQIASSEDLDRFADSLMASLETSKAPEDLEKLAYLCYAAKCIHGPLSAKTQGQIKALEDRISARGQGNGFTEQVMREDNTARIIELCELAIKAFDDGSEETAYKAVVAALAALEQT